MTLYESMILTPSTLTSDEHETLIGRYVALIGERKGEVLKTDNWGKRVLAYEINNETEGVYTLIEFKGEGELVKELDRKLRIDESVMRHLVINKEHDVKLQEKADRKKKNNRKEAPALENTESADSPESGTTTEEA